MRSSIVLNDVEQQLTNYGATHSYTSVNIQEEGEGGGRNGGSRVGSYPGVPGVSGPVVNNQTTLPPDNGVGIVTNNNSRRSVFSPQMPPLFSGILSTVLFCCCFAYGYYGVNFLITDEYVCGGANPLWRAVLGILIMNTIFTVLPVRYINWVITLL
jgi:hypothetical protein